MILKKNATLEELRDVKHKDLKDLVYRMQLTYDEITDKLDLKKFPPKRIEYSLKPNIYQISGINNTLKSILPNNLTISVTIDEKLYKLNLKINQTLMLFNKSFFYAILGFTQSKFYPFDVIDDFYQLIPGS